MKITPTFVVAGILCAAPFALAVRDDLKHKGQIHDEPGDDDSFQHSYDRGADLYAREHEDTLTDDDTTEVVADNEPTARANRTMKAEDLGQIMGTEPATMGPLLAGITLGAPSDSFQSDAARERIETFAVGHQLTVDFDFDFVALNGITVRVSGDEDTLRDAVIAAWGTPRRLSEDELVWLGADQQRAVYTAMSDGFDLRFEHYTTIDQVIAPKDRAKLGIEPFPLVGSTRAKLEKAMGPKLQESSYDDELSWAAPGIGNGSGKTMVKVLLDPDAGTKIIGLTVEGSTNDIDAVQQALVAKWGTPKLEDELLTWKKNGVAISVQLYDAGFVIEERR